MLSISLCPRQVTSITTNNFSIMVALCLIPQLASVFFFPVMSDYIALLHLSFMSHQHATPLSRDLSLFYYFYMGCLHICGANEKAWLDKIAEAHVFLEEVSETKNK